MFEINNMTTAWSHLDHAMIATRFSCKMIYELALKFNLYMHLHIITLKRWLGNNSHDITKDTLYTYSENLQ